MISMPPVHSSAQACSWLRLRLAPVDLEPAYCASVAAGQRHSEPSSAMPKVSRKSSSPLMQQRNFLEGAKSCRTGAPPLPRRDVSWRTSALFHTISPALGRSWFSHTSTSIASPTDDTVANDL